MLTPAAHELESRALSAILRLMCKRESLFIRTLGVGLVTLALSFQESIAVAQDICGCNRVVPYPGSYRIDFPEKADRPGVGGALVEVSNIDGFLGTQITASAPGGSLALECRPDGAFTGFMQPMNQPSRIPAGVIGALAGGYIGINGEIPTGLSMVSEFNVIVVRPGQMPAAANEVMEPTLMFRREGGSGQVPEEMCNLVRKRISTVDNFIAAYSDTDLIAKAESVNRPAVSTEYMASKDGSDDLGMVYETDHHDQSYRSQLLIKHIDKDMKPGTTETDSDGTGEAASTDGNTCLITPPKARNYFGKCRTAIEISAIMKHEEIHRVDCKKKIEDHGPEGFVRWVNHPSNLALTELRAHGAERIILQEWLEDNCGG